MGTLVGKSIVNVTSEMIITVLAALTAAGGVLVEAAAGGAVVVDARSKW